MNRELDGVYFRIKREGKWDNICFSDLNDNEMKDVLKNKDDVWKISLLTILADVCKRLTVEAGVSETEIYNKIAEELKKTDPKEGALSVMVTSYGKAVKAIGDIYDIRTSDEYD